MKKVLLTLAAFFLIWQSYDLLRHIDRLETDSWVLLVFTAWVINMFITGIFAFTVFAYPAHRLLPASYYKIGQPEKLKKIHSWLKVEWFRKALLATLWRGKKQRKKYFNGKQEGIDQLDGQSMKSEFGHLLPFVILTGVSVYLVAAGQGWLGLLTFLINVPGNFYPILLQRHHRMRTQAIRERLEAAKARR